MSNTEMFLVNLTLPINKQFLMTEKVLSQTNKYCHVFFRSEVMFNYLHISSVLNLNTCKVFGELNITLYQSGDKLYHDA